MLKRRGRGKRYWYRIVHVDFGVCWTGKPRKSDGPARLKFISTNKRLNGRHGRYRQPLRKIKCGWYYDYMMREWWYEASTLRDLRHHLIKVR